MATTTPKLGLPRPEGHDNVTRANHVELIDAIDENAASQSELNSVKNIAEKHADRHAAGGPDAITPSMIGAAPASHTHSASDITSGTLSADRIPNISASKITSGTLSVSRGGTGASSAADARSNLGLTGNSNTTHYHDGRYARSRVSSARFEFYNGSSWVRIPNITHSTSKPSNSQGENGDIWFVYE